MACNCGTKARIRAAVDSKFRVVDGKSSSTASLLDSIRKRRLEAIEQREREKRQKRRLLTPDEVVKLSHGEKLG